MRALHSGRFQGVHVFPYFVRGAHAEEGLRQVGRLPFELVQHLVALLIPDLDVVFAILAGYRNRVLPVRHLLVVQVLDRHHRAVVVP